MLVVRMSFISIVNIFMVTPSIKLNCQPANRGEVSVPTFLEQLVWNSQIYKS